MRIEILLLFFIGLIMNCSAPDTKNKKEDFNEGELKSLTHDNEESNEIKDTLTEVDTIGYKSDYHVSGNIKWKYYYKEVEEFGKTIKYDKDFIDSKSIIINGILPNFSSIPIMKEKLGEPDSVIFAQSEIDNSEDSYIYYYPNMKIRVYKRDSLMRLESIIFSENKAFFDYKGMIFNSNTALFEFQKFFPLSYLNAVKNINSNNETISKCWLDFFTSEKHLTDDKFTLTFYDDKLFSISYWSPI